MADPNPIHPEDILPVRSRVSWGALFAGVFAALAVMVLLTMLGTALGLTWSEHTSRGDYVASGAAIWAAITGLIALFFGGFITSLFTAGENRLEAVVYGIVLWGLSFACVAGVSFAGARFAVGGVLGTANVVTSAAGGDWEQVARDAGVSQDQINQMRARMPAVANMNPTVNPAAAARAAWWTLLGTVLSMIAAVCGTLAGCGPVPYLRGLLIRRTALVPAPAPGSTMPPR
jgi:hypothetical protein